MSADNVFLAPRSNETSYKNFGSTIIGGRDYSEIEPFLNSAEKEILSKYEKVSIWGNKESLRSRWEQMEPGDLVLFYAKGGFYYSGRVTLKKFDASLGEKLWPVDKDGRPWPCLFFIDNLTEINIPIHLVQELAEYSSDWDRVQGFMRLNDHGVAAIKRKFGSLEAFVYQRPDALEAIQNIIEDSKDEIVEAPPQKRNILEILAQAREYTDQGPGYTTVATPQKRRIESKEQKHRVAEIEGYACQICNWSLEWTNSKGEKVMRIDVDHIVDKSKGGGEELGNLWVLCPNCHAAKTLGVITVDLENKKIYRDKVELTLNHDKHLFV